MTRRTALIAGGCCAGAFVLLALMVGFAPRAIDPVDGAWNALMARVRPDAAVQASLVLNAVGGGWIATRAVPLALAVAVVLVRGWRTAAAALMMMLASALAVQAVKHLIGRARPEELLIGSDFGSFPSGHTANAATIAVVLCLILPRAIGPAVGIAWTVLMALSRTVLSVHWLSDTVGGALLGAAVALLLLAALPVAAARSSPGAAPADDADGRAAPAGDRGAAAS